MQEEGNAGHPMFHLVLLSILKTRLTGGWHGWQNGNSPMVVGVRVTVRTKEATDVANTCIALQAFFRAGHSPATGAHQAIVKKGLDYVLSEITASKPEELYVTKNRSTQIQRKLGTYVDTFMAASVLPDFKGSMATSESEQELEKAIIMVLSKMERHQQEDGTWRGTGWAPALAQGLANKGLSKAAVNGFKVNRKVRRKAEKNQQALSG